MNRGEFKPNNLRRKYVDDWGPTSHPRPKKKKFRLKVNLTKKAREQIFREQGKGEAD